MKNHKNQNVGLLLLEIYGTKVLCQAAQWRSSALIKSAKLKARVEKRTGWTGEQLEHRGKRGTIPSRQSGRSTGAGVDVQRPLWNTGYQPTGRSCDSGLLVASTAIESGGNAQACVAQVIGCPSES